MRLEDIKKIYFIGIGGIGVSAVARMMLQQKVKVSGSDMSESEITRELERQGARIYIGHSAAHVAPDCDAVVYSPAVAETNPELLRAKELGIIALSYPEMLGIISKGMYTIAVSGTHGKTTTTAMVGAILKESGLDPTMIVGSLLRETNSNFVAGKGEYFVVEACEYKKSFLHINPRIIVITNIDGDHLDYYGSIENIRKAFAEFVGKLGENDYLVCDVGGAHIREVLKTAQCKVVNYQDSSADLYLKVPGRHNLANAKAAYAVARTLGIEDAVIRTALENFSGTWRRFEYKGTTKSGALVYDDYAHHPTEIRATLAAAKEAFPGKKIICVFQPHLYSRTKLLMEDFAQSFSDADAVAVVDIYAAREEDDGTHSRDLVRAIQPYHRDAQYLASFDEAREWIAKNAHENDCVLTMGAGDVYTLTHNLR